MEGQPDSPAFILRQEAELIARTGDTLANEIEQAVAILRIALENGRLVSVCGNRISGALVAAAGFDYGVFLPPGQAGDVILVVLPEDPPQDLLGVVAAARKRGITAIAVFGSTLSSFAAADLLLRIPSGNTGSATLAISAVLHALQVLLLANTHVHGGAA